MLLLMMGFICKVLLSDYQDYQRRKATKQLEFLWRPSVSLGKGSGARGIRRSLCLRISHFQPTDILAHSMWDETYCYPRDFDFDGGDAPINDDPRIEGVNIQQRADQFFKLMQEVTLFWLLFCFVNQFSQRLQAYQSQSDVFVTFGCDFGYQNGGPQLFVCWFEITFFLFPANINFKNMDKLMRFINARQSQYNLNVIYSTPSIYVNALNSQKLAFPLKTDDIFP